MHNRSRKHPDTKRRLRRCGAVLGTLLLLSHVTQADQAAPSPADSEDNAELVAAGSSLSPVKLGGQTVFDITNGIGKLSSAQRADAIERRLEELANGSASMLAELRVVELDHVTEIFAGDALIRTITEADALAGGGTRQQLAAQQMRSIRAALASEFRDRDKAHILQALLDSGIATLTAGALLMALRWLSRRTHAFLNGAANGGPLKNRLAKLKQLDPQAVTKVSRSISRVVAWAIGMSITYVYLEYVLSRFPWTRGFAAHMADESRAAVLRVFLGVLNYLPNVINIVLIVAVARFALGVMKRAFAQVAAKRFRFARFHPEWAMPTYSLVRFFVIAVATIMVFPYLPGSGSAGFKGVSAFVGLMVSFGAAPAISNLIAGIILTYMRPFQIADRVKIADATGDILGKDLLVVRMRTIKNVDITIPNALVLANHIINFSSSAKTHGLILNTTITIGYDAPWKQVHALLIEAAKAVDGVLTVPSPFVLQTTLDDSYVAYEINAYTERPNEMAALYSRLNESIQDVFNAAGVEILSPRYAAVRDGNKMAVPENYLPQDYEAPGFSILSRALRRNRS
jgi:small-conductance mechanosensitive channel